MIFCVAACLPGILFTIGERTAFLVVLGISVPTLLLVAAVCRMRVVITTDAEALHARCMGIFQRHFRWEEITSIEPGPDTGFSAGMGLRMLPGGVTGLLVGGPSVRLRCSGQEHLLSTSNPEHVIAEIQSRMTAVRT